MPESPSSPAAQLERRRHAATERWALNGEVVLVAAGEPIGIPGRADLTYPFRAHSEYFYLTDRERPGGVLAFDAAEGWSDFVVPVSAAEALWEGASPDEVQGIPVAELEPWLERRAGRPLAVLGAPLPLAGPRTADPALAARLRLELNHVRRAKDAVELERMRAAARATRAGFAAIAPLLAPGRTEREVRIELEAEFQRRGADGPGYGTIVGSGPNSAVLHFPPSWRPFADGELVLIDSGAESRGYVSDVTRTYAVSGTFSETQAELHGLVGAALAAARRLCLPGTEWRDVHRAAALTIAEGLAGLRLLRGTPEGLVEQGAVSVFFPHGIGHMVGLGVRDAGEVLPGRRPDPTLYPNLRVDLPLEIGHVVTVEPGVYFVPALVHDPEARERLGDAVAWERAEQLLGFGGIRIEDNVLITAGEPDVLTADIP